jgi:hypothetical protein
VRGSVHWCGGGNLPGVKDILVELQNIKENYKLSELFIWDHTLGRTLTSTAWHRVGKL